MQRSSNAHTTETLFIFMASVMVDCFYEPAGAALIPRCIAPEGAPTEIATIFGSSLQTAALHAFDTHLGYKTVHELGDHTNLRLGTPTEDFLLGMMALILRRKPVKIFL